MSAYRHSTGLGRQHNEFWRRSRVLYASRLGEYWRSRPLRPGLNPAMPACRLDHKSVESVKVTTDGAAGTLAPGTRHGTKPAVLHWASTWRMRVKSGKRVSNLKNILKRFNVNRGANRRRCSRETAWRGLLYSLKSMPEMTKISSRTDRRRHFQPHTKLAARTARESMPSPSRLLRR